MLSAKSFIQSVVGNYCSEQRNKKSKRIAFGSKEHTKSRKSETRFDWVSSYICNTVVYEAAYTIWRRLKRIRYSE